MNRALGIDAPYLQLVTYYVGDRVMTDAGLGTVREEPPVRAPYTGRFVVELDDGGFVDRTVNEMKRPAARLHIIPEGL
jgi:hypothetical protein